jgi:rhodanese-related sulfurtransferase
VHIGLGSEFANQVSTLLADEHAIVLISVDVDSAKKAHDRLVMAGIEGVVGFLAGSKDSWLAAGGRVTGVWEVTPSCLAECFRKYPNTLQIVDVRTHQEWEHGYIESAVHWPLEAFSLAQNRLAGVIARLDPKRPVVVYCQEGSRSLTAASLLKRSEVRNVINLKGGFDAWTNSG